LSAFIVEWRRAVWCVLAALLPPKEARIMKIKLWQLLLTAVLLSAAPVWADDGFYVIGVGGKPVGKEITSLPCTISESGMYYLSKNLLQLLYTGSAITVSASNVTLDLMGFTLNGISRVTGGAHGIWINEGTSGVEVRNGCITNFVGDGVHCLGQNCRLLGLRVTNVGGAGISENGKNQVISCFASGCGHEGIYSGGSSMLKGNTVNGNATNGITAGDNCTMMGNTVSSNGQYGISSGNSCTVTGNSTQNSSNHGIRTGDHCSVTGNSSQNNTGSGIQAGLASLVQGNTASGNGGNGIYVSEGSTVAGNTARGNGGYGIWAVAICLVIDNSLINNTAYGIFAGNGCTITRNTAYNLAIGTVGINAGNACTITNNTTRLLGIGEGCTVVDNTVY
jgi:parallel beta-helix repeat protein